MSGSWERALKVARQDAEAPVALFDWYGAHNVFFVCDGAYGRGWITRTSSPSVEARLRELAVADGAFGPNGDEQIAVVTSKNANPTHAAHPGNNLGC